MQKNWIGKSRGLNIKFTSDEIKNLIAFTTRPDTLFGVTYLAVSINHDLAVSLSGSDVR